VPVRIAKIEAAAAAPIVELAIFEAPRRAAEYDLGFFDPAEDRVKLAAGDMEREIWLSKSASSSNSKVSSLFTRTGAKCPVRARFNPKIWAKNFAAATLSRAGTMVWLSVMVMSAPFGA
jgi:hypothetical protein